MLRETLVVLQLKMSLGLKHWKIEITLIMRIICSNYEKNPGPFNIAGIVQVSYQGREKIGATQGIQRTCISLYSVCF